MSFDPEIYNRYPKEIVDEAVEVLNYKKVDPLPKTEIAGKPTFYVFRHGQSTDNEEMLFSGWRDVDLTEQGVKQALVLADKLKDKKLDLLVASDLTRAIHTMQIAVSKNEKAKNLEIMREPRIKERSYGELQGTSKLELFLKDPELTHEYRRSYDKGTPSGENLATVVNRVTEFIEEMIPKMKAFNINVAVSCHGNSMRGFRQYFEKLTNEQTALVETPLGQDYAAYCVE